MDVIVGPKLHANGRNRLVFDANVNRQTATIPFRLIERTPRSSIELKLSKFRQGIANLGWRASEIVVESTNTLHLSESIMTIPKIAKSQWRHVLIVTTLLD